jgi:phosphoserine phosphatase SerB
MILPSGPMTPRGTEFLLKIGPGESTLGKLLELESRGHVPVGVRRRGSQLFITLAEQTSTQRVAEVVGPSVPVSLGLAPSMGEEPPGTDWLLRLVGPRYVLLTSIGRLIRTLNGLSGEIGGTDVASMDLSGIDPAILDLRISTGQQQEFRVRRVDILELGEELGITLLVQPLSEFKKGKGLACFDLDSTLVSEELITEVAKVVGKEAAVAEITEQAMRGDIDYKRSFIHRVALLRGAREADLEEIWRGLAPSLEVARLIAALRMRGVRTAILSGAFAYFTERARDRLGMDFEIGNKVEIEDGVLTGNVRGEIVDAKMKLRKMREFAAQLGLTLDKVVAVGDGANDLEIIRESGTGVAYNKGGVVKCYADAVIPDGQLGNLLYLLPA